MFLVRKCSIRELASELVMDVLFGRSSDFYANAYKDGLIDESYSYSFMLENGFGFSMISSDSENPEDLEKAIRSTLQEATTTWPITDEDLDRQRKRKIGQFMRSLNSIEFIANQFTRYSFNDMNLFDVVPTLEKMTLEDLKNAFSTFNDENGFTVYTVLPAEKENDIINVMQ